MITSPSPTLLPNAHASPSTIFTGRPQYESGHRSAALQTSSVRTRRLPAPPATNSTQHPLQLGTGRSPSALQQKAEHKDRDLVDRIPRHMVDASTQYSPPPATATPAVDLEAPISTAPDVQLSGSAQFQGAAQGSAGIFSAKNIQVDACMPVPQAQAVQGGVPPTSAKRSTSVLVNASTSESETGLIDEPDVEESPSSKRQRPAAPAARLMPMQYETCDPHDLVILISSMLMELVRYNDAIPLRDGHLTRFHSRAPPGISVLDYLQRLTTHATLSPPILLSMVYYIDKLCALYPAFTISSLTVHRFLITSATVASKGLSDSFWTNKTYARVGGVSLKELALLELEFLWRVEWRIVPKPEVLVDYYRSLVERSDGYEIDITGRLEEEADAKAQRGDG